MGEFISNPEIDERYNKLVSYGADGGRLIGAGTAGYLMVIVPQEKQLHFLASCAEENIEVERISIDTMGARIL